MTIKMARAIIKTNEIHVYSQVECPHAVNESYHFHHFHHFFCAVTQREARPCPHMRSYFLFCYFIF